VPQVLQVVSQVPQVVSQANKAGFQIQASKGVHHQVPPGLMVPIRAAVLSVIRMGYRDNLVSLVSLVSKAGFRVSKVVSRVSKAVSQVSKAAFRASNRSWELNSFPGVTPRQGQ
jgi:hypothetical protein